MAKVLFLHPNRWGRGITALWIPSHSAVLKHRGHDVRLFDATFYNDWTVHENKFNTSNKQYMPSAYDSYVHFSNEPVFSALQKCINEFQPDIIFWSAISSHIHGEGEYVNLEYGYNLIINVARPKGTVLIAGGLQPTADPEHTARRFPLIDYFVCGESEYVLSDFVGHWPDRTSLTALQGLVYRQGDGCVVNPRQERLQLKDLPLYDYSLFDDQVFFRPYNGQVVRAVDYELSRGCMYTCSYCVETVIQKYYGFEGSTDRGVLLLPGKYLRSKSTDQIYAEMHHLHHQYGVTLFRSQDTNFLSIDRSVLHELAERMGTSNLPIMLYIETRPDGINPDTIKLMKKLRVDGIGMGIELAADGFREKNLNRHCTRERIEKVFAMLKDSGIKRTGYNIIGLPEQDESMVLETIEFNRKLNPDNVTVAYYSPYLGTAQQRRGAELNEFEDYEYNVDAQLRTLSKSTCMSKEILEFYKKNFVRLVQEGLGQLDALKSEFGIKF